MRLDLLLKLVLAVLLGGVIGLEREIAGKPRQDLTVDLARTASSVELFLKSPYDFEKTTRRPRSLFSVS